MRGRSTTIPAWLDTASAVSWRLVTVAAAGFVALVVASQLTPVLLPVVGALFLTVVLSPPTRWLRRHGWPPLAATWAVFLVAGALVLLLGAWLAPRVAGEIDPLRQKLGNGLDVVRQWLTHGPLHLSGEQVDRYIDLDGHLTAGAGGDAIVRGAVRGVRMMVDTVAGLGLTVVLAFFFVKDGPAIDAWVRRQFQPATAARLAAVRLRGWQALAGYIRGSAVNGLVNGAVMALGLLVLKVPLVAPITTLTVVAGFFPIVGALVSGAIAALVGLVSSGPQTALLVVILTIVIHHIEGYLVGPVVLGRAVRLHKAVIILALAAGATLAGAVGAFLAVPAVAVGAAVVDELRNPSATRR